MKDPQAQRNSAKSKAFTGVLIYAVAVLGLLFFGYNAARAWLVAFTHDEAYTFNEYVRNSLWEIVRINGSNSNNHVLNTLVIKAFYNVLGDHWFVLRLHCVILYGIYLFYGYKLLQHVKSQILLICGFILLSANPFLFDFFSLARGYLPSLACTLVSLYFAIQYIEFNKPKSLWESLIISAIGVIFHLSFLNYFVPLCGLLLLYMLWPKNASGWQWKNVFRKGWPVLLVLLLVVSYALPVSLWIKQLGEMDLAGKTGFWQDTVLSLLGFSFYNQPYTAGEEFLKYVAAIIIMLLIFCAVLLLNNLRGRRFYEPFTIVSILLLMMFLCIEAQHFIMNNPFPNGRLALYFMPLFVLLVVYGFDKLNHFYIGTIAGSILTIFSVFHFIQSINFTKTTNFTSDADTPQMLSFLYQTEGNRKASDPVKLGSAWTDEPCINYYRIHHNYNWLRNQSRAGFLHNDEYIYTSPETFKYFNKDIIKAIKIFPSTGNILARNIYADSLRSIFTKTATFPDKFIVLDTAMSSPLIQLQRNDIQSDSVLVEAQAWVLANKEYVGGDLVIAADHFTGNSIWRSVRISDGVMKAGAWQMVSFCTVISLKNQPHAQVKSYIWNTGKIPLQVAHLQLKIYDLTTAKPLYVHE